ncbi:uncharacterized protein LOC123671927 isoform X2 [Harmonia axyridis]|uniref:uncharacterized protein LOC123671927 isoform X2 n=1 Tax=Harmonia axyridis TaxID=115357 RepID=UPI001E274FE8|nr:uncharacterized protein LOC123671927 isoform X2 [Harmonia axyridis]
MLKFITNTVKSKCVKENHCTVCHVGGMLRFTFIFIPIRKQCQHLDKNYKGKPCFEIAYRWLWISYILASLLVAACYIQFQEAEEKLKSSEDLTSKIDGLIALEELCYFSFFLFMYLAALLMFRTRLAFLNSVVNLMENQYYIEMFGSPWDPVPNTKFGRKRTVSTIGFVVVELFLATIYQQSKLIFINVCFISTVLLLTLLGVQILREIGKVMEFKTKIDTFLMNRLKKIDEKNEICAFNMEDKARRIELLEQLEATELYYSECYTCVDEHLNAFLGPIIILWCMSSLIMLVLDFYMLVLLIEKGLWYKNLVDEFRTYAHVLIVIFMMRKGTLIASISDDTLSFLFKYPISKLSETEAYQVEMLIYTLSTHKPTIKASDIFTVGTKLLASISGTVVTYVLVALQFRPAWRE